MSESMFRTTCFRATWEVSVYAGRLIDGPVICQGPIPNENSKEFNGALSRVHGAKTIEEAKQIMEKWTAK